MLASAQLDSRSDACLTRICLKLTSAALTVEGVEGAEIANRYCFPQTVVFSGSASVDAVREACAATALPCNVVKN